MKTRRIPSWAALSAVVVSLSLVVAVGCKDRTPSPVAAKGGAEEVKPAAIEGKALADWPDDLAGTLMISGEMIGYLEPCGCTQGQRGGLIRRMALADLIRNDRKWPLALIDLGGLINDPNTAHGGGVEETKIRFDTALKALTMLKYSAVALSADDLKLGADHTLITFVNTLPETADAPRFVAANVVPAEGLGFEKKIRPSVRTQVGPVKLGVTAVLDRDAFDKLRDSSKDLLTVKPPEESLPGVLADLEKDTDTQVLMVQGPPAMAKKLAEAFPGFDMVVATSETPDPPDRPEILNGGKTWLIGVGRKGQYVAMIGFPKNPSDEKRYQRVSLGQRYDQFKNLSEPMRKLIDEDFVANLRSADVVGNYPKLKYTFASFPISDAKYIGASKCAECHPNTFARWSKTKHAAAYDALTSNPKRNREADADCVRCHTTGFEYIGGFVSAASLPDLKGNQCENCHGPGSRHAAYPDDKEIRKTVARSAQDFEKQHRCLQCHDEDNAPHGFDFPKMWSQIVHAKLDSYDDPKVHQGLVPK